MTSIQQQGALAQIGKSFQPEFLQCIADQALDLAIEQLRAHQVPEQVISLLEAAIQVESYTIQLQAGALNDTAAVDIADTLPEMTRLIWNLGGSFQNQNGVYRK